MWADVDKRIRRAVSGIRQAFRGTLTRTSNGAGSQLAQVDALSDERLQDAELFQQFGFTSNPPPGTAVIVLPMGGRTSHGIIIATENGQFRIKGLAPGETAIFNAFGDHFVFKDGQIDGTTQTFNLTATKSMKFDSPTTEFTGQVTVQQQLSGNGGLEVQGGSGVSFVGSVSQTGGSYSTDGDVIASGTSVHGHKHNGDSGGQTSTPL
ncbi:phage baseplate assembly protein V [Craterilacuibacter sinensis]|uniref:Phage baseplate assembly protein V n=1 Tax=Craterilacuibacter sinensis TaxID=2686017 RepID=A0A845BKB4_9NEIS|nr:phage baseplate assembly protein V [Craterilacuibacter sinensis]MXR36702.1 phage baseplate assembly protein V [Craterilacuibacter sinensis]